MKWVELKNYLAPTFMKEIDHVCEIFISKLKININFIIFFSLIELIKELQKDRYNDENIEAYLDLRESIEDRIEEIENFYEINFDQPYAQHFEKGRIKLKKLLMFEPFAINEIKVGNNNFVNKKKKIKNNAYEINPLYKNTNDNHDNSTFYNEYIIGEREEKPNKTKKTIIMPRKEKIQFIPMEVKKKTNVYSVEKLKSSKNNMKMNNTRNRKYRDVDDNNIYINEQNKYYNQGKYSIPNEQKQFNYVLNKYKKTKMSSSMDRQYINDGYNNGYRQNKNRKKLLYFDEDENE